MPLEHFHDIRTMATLLYLLRTILVGLNNPQNLILMFDYLMLVISFTSFLYHYIYLYFTASDSIQLKTLKIKIFIEINKQSPMPNLY